MYNSNMRKLDEVIVEKLIPVIAGKYDTKLPCFFIGNHITIGTAFPGLVAKDEGEYFLVPLGGEQRYRDLHITDNNLQNCEGVLVPNIEFEVQLNSFCQTHNYEIDITGALLRRGKNMKILVSSEAVPSRAAILLKNGLTDTNKIEAIFTDWQIVVGEGENKQILWDDSFYPFVK